MMNTIQMTSKPAVTFAYRAQRDGYRTYRQNHSGRHQRMIQRNRHILLFTVVTVMLLLMVVLAGSSFFGLTDTQATGTKEIYKYYTSIEVQDGDSLWSIADRYITADYPDHEAYMQELVSLNHLTDTTIHAGSYLTVPYYSDIAK